MELEDFVDGAAIIGLNCTYAGNKVISAFRLYLKMHNENLHHTTNPSTGEEDYTIDIIGRLCEESGIKSNSSPKVLVALCYMMLAEYHNSNGRESDAAYCIHVVENIRVSGFSICESTIRNCKEWVKEIGD